MNSNITPVGIIGLGLMGQAFAKRLAEKHIAVLGFDINQERCNEFGSDRTCQTPNDLAKQCETLILCLFDGKQISQVLLGENGIIHDSSSIVQNIICTSTCEPNEVIEIAKACEDHGVHFLEMPISGTSKQVSNGDSLGLMGGDDHLIKQLEPILSAMCQKRMHVGGIGNASKSKLAVNLVLGLHRAALAEGLVFGSQIGLDPTTLLNILQNSAAASSVMKVKGPLMANRDYDNPQSRVDQSLKDFGLIQKLASQSEQVLPFATQYIQLLESCVQSGEGKKDNAIIAEAIRRNGNINK